MFLFKPNRCVYLCLLFITLSFGKVFSQQKNDLAVIAYYAGNGSDLDSFDVKQLTHIIFSFCHLKGNLLHVNNARDTATIQKLVTLKQKNPNLKIMLSLGGWGGCETCSPVFAVPENRIAFAQSVKEISRYFGIDGIDLDWEYPTIEGYPGHPYSPQDKETFTALIQRLRATMGNNFLITFAAGGFQRFLDKAVDWKSIMPVVDWVNIMSYDLVNGYSKVTGFHTPLYSTKENNESTDNAVKYLLGIGIPANKLVIGAAFYTRVWKNVANVNHGLYQSGEHTNGVNYKSFDTKLNAKNSGFIYYWNDTAQAPFWYNATTKTFASGDDKRSVKLKTKYASDNRLKGIMFWELTLDTYKNGLVNEIYNTAVLGK
ncbi:MAG: glycoside hydrolase family 18 protein [Chitinophagaceae bacterium]|jgi:chitinase|nr:glycoside hydrolase family 18 protein [Chitinophagaceae bacterium]